MSMMNPVESPPLGIGAVPDRSEGTLRFHLMKALEIAGRDSALTPDEMREIGAFLQGLQSIAQGRAANGEAPMDGQQMLSAAGGPQMPPMDTEPYGATAGTSPAYPE